MSQDSRSDRPHLVRLLKGELADSRALYIFAIPGAGKTAIVSAALDDMNVTFTVISAASENFLDLLRASEVEYIVIDHLQDLDAPRADVRDTLTEKYKTSTIVFISRARVPVWLKSLQIDWHMKVIRPTTFQYSAAEFDSEIEKMNISPEGLKSIDPDAFIEEVEGWPVAVDFFYERLLQPEYRKNASGLAILDAFEYLDTAIMLDLSDPMKKLLISLGHLRCFSAHQAQVISGEVDARILLEKFISSSCVLEPTGVDAYCFRPFFHKYLQWKQNRELDTSERNSLMEATALFYSNTGETLKALEYYELAGNKARISELLIKQSQLEPYKYDCCSLADYYLGLPEKLVDASPELLSVLAMLHSLRLNEPESERCVQKLRDLERELPACDARHAQARKQIVYLMLSLPKFGNRNYVDVIKQVAPMVAKEGMNLPSVSFSGGMPSILNGSLDLSPWGNEERSYYNEVGDAIVVAFGLQASGIAQIGLAESLFEHSRDKDFTKILTLLNRGLTAAESSGNIDLQWAARGVMARVFVAQGYIDAAIGMVDKFMRTLEVDTPLHRSARCLILRLNMFSGNSDGVEAWLCNESPDEFEGLNMMNRYGYLTKILAFIVTRRYARAFELIGRLTGYAEMHDRPAIAMELEFLKAIVFHRTGESAWHEHMARAIHMGEEVQSLRLLSEYGPAAVEMLNEMVGGKEDGFLTDLYWLTFDQSIRYPHYLELSHVVDFHLTETEKKVLKLLGEGLSNDRLASLMGVSINTVKFHTRNIYQKLGVSGRIKAVRFAQEKGML